MNKETVINIVAFIALTISFTIVMTLAAITLI
jgi:hypothetical protein